MEVDELRRRCDKVYASRPSWVQGTISRQDAWYLYERVTAAPAGTVLEIGTASGVSTGIICAALEAGDPHAEKSLVTYDISPTFYAAPEHRTGSAAREMVSAEAFGRITFRNPATAVDVHRELATDEVSFLFLDANHMHPHPTLDLLAALEPIRPGAEVFLHDVNLPLIHPQFAVWGAKWLYESLDVEKRLNPHDDSPNIGSFVMPADKAALREQLLGIVDAHPWECTIDPDDVAAYLEP